METLDVNVLKTDYLLGVSLDDGKGSSISDATLTRFLGRACTWMESQIHIRVKSKDVVEYHDYHIDEYVNFCFLKLFEYPVIEITQLKAIYGDQEVMTFPNSWIKFYPETGQIQLVPTAGSLSSVLLGKGSATLLPMISNSLSYMPFMFVVTYKAGFKDNALPENIADLIYCEAAINALILASSLLMPGVSTTSISLDGLSQNISTPRNGENEIYGPKIKLLKEKIKDELPALQKYYKGIRFTVA